MRPFVLRSAGLIALAIAFLSSPCSARESPWNQLRGPNHGHAIAIGLPTSWSEEQNVVWKIALPGVGFSSPIVSADGRIWLTTAVGPGSNEEPDLGELPSRSLRALAVDFEKGSIVHDVEVFKPEQWQPSHRDNSYASPTSVTDGTRVYVHFGTYGTAALDAASGSIVWRNSDLVIDHEVGPGSSPILHKGLLLINCDGTDKRFVAALDADSGSLAWKADRSIDLAASSPSHRKAFSTPTIVGFGGEDRLISTAASQAGAYDPASGAEIWRVRFEGYSNVPQPVSGLGMVFITTGYIKPRLLAIRLGGRGDVTDSHTVWSYRWQVPANPSPLVVGDRLFMISDWGLATWLDARVGRDIWRHRVGGRFYASPLHILGKIYTFSVEGESVVIAAEDEYRQISVNRLDGVIRATPAVFGRSLIIRTTTHLYRIEAPSKPSTSGS